MSLSSDLIKNGGGEPVCQPLNGVGAAPGEVGGEVVVRRGDGIRVGLGVSEAQRGVSQSDRVTVPASFVGEVGAGAERPAQVLYVVVVFEDLLAGQQDMFGLI